MGYHEGTMQLDNPVITYLSERIHQKRIYVEWLLEIRLPEQQRHAVSHIEHTLNDGSIQFASTAVGSIQDILNLIKDEAKELQDLLEERSRLLGTELSEQIYIDEQAAFKANGHRWITEADKNG